MVNIEIDTTTTGFAIIIDEAKKYSFLLDQEINLTDFIKSISDSNSIINIGPDRSALLQKNPGSDINKLITYIVKIIDAFNEAFTDVNKEDE